MTLHDEIWAMLADTLGQKRDAAYSLAMAIHGAEKERCSIERWPDGVEDLKIDGKPVLRFHKPEFTTEETADGCKVKVVMRMERLATAVPKGEVQCPECRAISSDRVLLHDAECKLVGFTHPKDGDILGQAADPERASCKPVRWDKAP